ncbi:MAG: hypothetical protein HUU21_23935 [Polyangiaceae bacterium]|nr:hypothetical protein [Polyangiaceae bacterium]
MKLTPFQIASLAAGVLAYIAVLYGVDRALKNRLVFRYFAAACTVVLFFLGVSVYVPSYDRSVDIVKAAIAITAAACVFYETHRAGIKRPIAERWKRFAGAVLAMAALVAYFNGFNFGFKKYYHRWDQFHYYMGAKYFRELGYAGLYKCAALAQADLGVVSFIDEDTGAAQKVDMAAEVRHPDKKIRNISGDNLLVPASSVLDKPEECSSRFSPERWESFKNDVAFFRIASGKQYWEDMQKDHGYNPPPVWTVAGHYLASLSPASTRYLQFLAAFDIAYLGGMFAALWWAFGWRVCAAGAIFFGCQASASTFWTAGAFLRQDWLFYLVLAACLTRKRYFALAGAAMVYSALLRVFPGLVVLGWLVVFFAFIYKNRRIANHHARMLAGGVLAAAVLIPLSLHVAGRDSYQQFYHHTIKVHDQTPLTNHMGLRVLVGHTIPVEIKTRFTSIGVGPAWGRMKYTKDTSLTDPFEVWKRMRNERYARLRPVAYGVIAASAALFIYVVRGVKSMWIAQCLGQIWIILLAQLTCYYYSFMILAAPLSKAKRGIEAPLFGLAALTQFIWLTFGYNDDKYYMLTAASLIFCYGLLCAFARPGLGRRIRKILGVLGEKAAPGIRTAQGK